MKLVLKKAFKGIGMDITNHTNHYANRKTLSPTSIHRLICSFSSLTTNMAKSVVFATQGHDNRCDIIVWNS